MVVSSFLTTRERPRPSRCGLTAIGHASTEAVPSAFSLDPEGNFLFAAGAESNLLAAYRVNRETGELTPLETYAVGKRPCGC
jgi:6-phosphogluconolactonase